MKFQNKLIAGFILLGSLSAVAQATTVTIGNLTATTPGNVGTLTLGTNYLLGDTGLFNFNTNLVNSNTTVTNTFYDDFVFTIASGSTLYNSFSASLQLPSFLGITGFTESLYSGTIPGNAYSATGSNPLASSSLIATMTGNTLSATNLSAGTYTLQFSGIIGKATTIPFIGTMIPATGTYASLVSVSPVPEADTYAMLLAGLSLLGFMVQRRKSRQLS
jgi:hypothetical protein